MSDEILNKLRYRSEGDDLDFKQAQYHFIDGNDIIKSEMLKDILAMANAWREGTGYIVLGFKDQRPHPAEVTGITGHWGVHLTGVGDLPPRAIRRGSLQAGRMSSLVRRHGRNRLWAPAHNKVLVAHRPMGDSKLEDPVEQHPAAT